MSLLARQWNQMNRRISELELRIAELAQPGAAGGPGDMAALQEQLAPLMRDREQLRRHVSAKERAHHERHRGSAAQTEYTTTNEYVPGTLEVYVDGEPVDAEELDLASAYRLDPAPRDYAEIVVRYEIALD